MTKRTRTVLTSHWWGREVSPGRAARRVAAAGGSVVNGFIAGIGGLWATPRTRRRSGGRRRSYTVSRRS